MRLENDLSKMTLALKDATPTEIDEIIEKLLSIKQEMETLDTQHTTVSKKKKAIRELGKDNLTITFKDKPHQKFQRTPKYQYTDTDGTLKTWWGGGKTPKVIKDAITLEDGSEDKTLLDQFLIPKTSQYKFKDQDGNVCLWDGNGETPKDLQTLLNNNFKLEDFEIKKTEKPKAIFVHPVNALYEYKDKNNRVLTWDPETEPLPQELLDKITVLGQPRPELLKKFLKV